MTERKELGLEVWSPDVSPQRVTASSSEGLSELSCLGKSSLWSDRGVEQTQVVPKALFICIFRFRGPGGLKITIICSFAEN